MKVTNSEHVTGEHVTVQINIDNSQGNNNIDLSDSKLNCNNITKGQTSENSNEPNSGEPPGTKKSKETVSNKFSVLYLLTALLLTLMILLFVLVGLTVHGQSFEQIIHDIFSCINMFITFIQF